MKKNLVLIAAIIIVVGAGSFYGGMRYGSSKNNAFPSRQGFNQMGGANLPDSFRNGANKTGNGGMVAGEIISKDDKSITVKLQSGGSKIVFISDSSEISKFASGAISDLEVGKSVMVTGSANQDGSVTAKTIQLRPAATAVAPVSPK